MVLILPLLACACWGQSGSEVAGPTLGFVWDPAARLLRPIAGMAGAAFVAKPMELGFALRSAAVSPRQDFALVLPEAGSELRLVRLREAAAPARAIDGALPDPDRIVFSPSGTAAALYVESAGTIQVITGLPERNTILRETVLSSPEERLLAIAVSDDGELLLTGTVQSSARMLGPEGFRDLPVAGPVSALAFRPHSHDALIATPDGVRMVRDIDTAARFQVVNPATDTVALAFSTDGKRAFAAHAEEGAITLFHLEQGTSTRIASRTRPQILYPLRGNDIFRDIFRINEISDGPLWLLDAGDAEPRVWFVPPATSDAGGAQ
jgi:hypothetical protein